MKILCRLVFRAGGALSSVTKLPSRSHADHRTPSLSNCRRQHTHGKLMDSWSFFCRLVMTQKFKARYRNRQTLCALTPFRSARSFRNSIARLSAHVRTLFCTTSPFVSSHRTTRIGLAEGDCSLDSQQRFTKSIYTMNLFAST